MAVGILLCLLAFLFAFEAKLACYGPTGSPEQQVSASKLAPADAPKHIAQALTPPEPVFHSSAAGALIPLLLIVALLGCAEITAPDRAFAVRFPTFLPSLFFRPPPRA